MAGRYDPTADLRAGLRGRTTGGGGGQGGGVAGANQLQQSIDALTRAVNQLAGTMGGNGGNNGAGGGGRPGQNGNAANGGNWQTGGGSPLTTPFRFGQPGQRAPATPGNRARVSGPAQWVNNNTNVSAVSAVQTMGQMSANYGQAHYSSQTLWDTYATTSSRNFGGYQDNLMAAKQFTYAGNGVQDTTNALSNATSYGGYQGFGKGSQGASFMGQAANLATATPGMSLTSAVGMANVRASASGQLQARMMGYSSAVNAQGQTKGTTQQLNDILARTGVNMSKLNKSNVAGIFNLNNGAVALNMRRLGYNDDQIQAYQQLAQEEVQGMSSGKYSQSQVADALSTSTPNKQQQAIQKAAGVGKGMANSAKVRDSMTQNREADQTQAFAGGMEDATKAVNEFSGAMNSFLKNTGIGNFIGRSSGGGSVLRSVPFGGKMLSALGPLGALVGGQGAPVGGGAKPAGTTTPNGTGGTSSSGATGGGAVKAALSQLGVPYVYGAESPGKAFDCSGLMQWAYSQIGVKIPRTVALQAKATPRVDPNDAQPGDLLTYENYGHVMMYMGNNTAVEAPHAGDHVKTIAANPHNAQEVHRVVKDAGMGSLVGNSTNDVSTPTKKTTTQNNFGGGGNSGTYGSAEEADIISSMSGATFGMSRSAGGKGDVQNGSQTSSGGMPTQASALGGSAAQNRALALQMAAARGWSGSDLTDLGLIGDAESGFQTDISNGGKHGYIDEKHAYGIPQALPGSKMASAGPDWKTNPATQIKWMLDYIQGRYGNPTKAWNTRQARNPHWYETGTGASGVHGDQMAMVHDGEIILNKKTSELVRASQRSGVADIKPFPQGDSPGLDSGPASLNSTKMGGKSGGVNINFAANAIRISVNGSMTDAAAQQAAKQFVGYVTQDARVQTLVTT